MGRLYAFLIFVAFTKDFKYTYVCAKYENKLNRCNIPAKKKRVISFVCVCLFLHRNV